MDAFSSLFWCVKQGRQQIPTANCGGSQRCPTPGCSGQHAPNAPWQVACSGLLELGTTIVTDAWRLLWCLCRWRRDSTCSLPAAVRALVAPPYLQAPLLLLPPPPPPAASAFWVHVLKQAGMPHPRVPACACRACRWLPARLSSGAQLCCILLAALRCLASFFCAWLHPGPARSGAAGCSTYSTLSSIELIKPRNTCSTASSAASWIATSWKGGCQPHSVEAPAAVGPVPLTGLHQLGSCCSLPKP
jgi:hypothetical protein